MKKVLSEFHLTPAQMKAINDEGKRKLKELKKKKETKETKEPKKRGRPKKVKPEPKKRGRPKKAIKVDLTALKKSSSAVKKKLMSDMKKRLLQEEATKKTDRKALIAKVAKEASEDDTLQSLSDRLKNVVVKATEAEFEPPAPKRRGRPPGSKNKPKSQLNEGLKATIDPDIAHYERMKKAQSSGQTDAEEALAMIAKAMKPKEIATQTAKPSLAPYPKPRSRKSTPSVTPVGSPIHEPVYGSKTESAEEQLARLVAESIANDKKVTVKDVEREAKKKGLQVKGERKIAIRKMAQALKSAAPKVTISHAGVKGAEAAEASDTRANGKLLNWAAKVATSKQDKKKVEEGKPLIVTDKEGKEHHADFLIEGVSVFIPRDSRLSDFGEMLHFNTFIEKLHDYMKTHTGTFGFVGGNAEQFDALKDVLPIEKLEAKNRISAPKQKFASEPKEEEKPKPKPRSKIGKRSPPPPPPPPKDEPKEPSVSSSKQNMRVGSPIHSHGGERSPGNSDEELSDSDNEGRGINFQDIKWGSLTEQFNNYKKHHKGIKSLDEFADHILSNPNDFNSRTRKRANFYEKVIKGKGIEEGESDSDTSSESSSDSDSDVSEGKISRHNIMPIVRPQCSHPATESSTMTMNPGAFNNIKPLLGHLMVGGGHPHTPVERTSNGMRSHSHYGPHAMAHHHIPMAMYEKHGAKRPHNHGGSISDLIHASAQHMTHHFGHPAPMALDIMNKAIRQGIDTLHPDVRPYATQALNGGHQLLARTIGGDFFGDLGNSIRGGFQDLGHQIENKASQVYNNDIKPALPGIVGTMNEYYNNPATQGVMSGISTALNSTGSPELGIPFSMANMALSNALDASAHGRDPGEQVNARYLDPAKNIYKKGRKFLGVGVGEDLGKNLATNLGRLADSGSNYLIRQMDGHGLPEEIENAQRIGRKLVGRGDKNLAKKLAEDHQLMRQMSGHGVGEDLGRNLATNLGRLADSGSNYLVRQMDGHGLPEEIENAQRIGRKLVGRGKKGKGKGVGEDLGRNLATNLGRLADSGSNYLVRQMDGHGLPEEIQNIQRIGNKISGKGIPEILIAKAMGYGLPEEIQNGQRMVNNFVGRGKKGKGRGIGEDLGRNLATNVGRLADSGSNYLVRQMDGHGVGEDLGRNLATNVGRLADSGSNYLIRQMDGHGCGGEIGDGLYAGRGLKGSPEMKEKMAKIRAMRGKGRGGAIPQPPSRSPVTR